MASSARRHGPIHSSTVVDVPDWAALDARGRAALAEHCKRLVAFHALGHPKAVEFATAVPADLDAAASVVLSFWFFGKTAFGFIGGRTPKSGTTLSFTLLDAMWQQVWFAKGDHQRVVDAAMTSRFAPLLARAAAGELDVWEGSAAGSLALIIVLDQFSRNIHRDRPKAWATDAAALAVMRRAMDRGFDEQLPPSMRCMMYMPLVHDETIESQARSEELMAGLCAEAGELQPAAASWFSRFNVVARRHRAVIDQFGRFPERNIALGRPSTAAEHAYLDGAQAGHTVKTKPS